MKKLLIACSMISACALVACADAVATTFTGTPKVEILDWFEVTTTATNHGALAIAEGSDALCEVTGSKFEIDSDLANPVVFTSSDSLTQELSKVAFSLDAAIVPTGALQDFSDSQTAPKVAFALYQTSESEKAFKAYVDGSWITLTGDVTVPTEGTQYTLLMEFDNRNDTKLVRFSVNETVLKNGDDEWIAYTGIDKDVMTINFVGCGKVTSFLGNQLNIIAEVVVIGGKGTIDVKKEDVAAFEKAKPEKYETVDLFLAASASEAFDSSSFQSGLTVAEAYAIGLVAQDASGKMVAVDNGALKVKADAQASTTDGIKVALNIAPPDVKDTGATISYQLHGSTDGTNFTAIEGLTFDEISKIKIPTDYVDGSNDKTRYRFFKVVTKVTLKPAE